MAGQLLEIDTELLRFSRDETRQFLSLRWPAQWRQLTPGT